MQGRKCGFRQKFIDLKSKTKYTSKKKKKKKKNCSTTKIINGKTKKN